jgi:hypothetical protein
MVAVPVYLQVSHDVAEHVVHASEALLSLLLLPPMPNEEISFRMFLLPQFLQETLFSPPKETRTSNCFPHPLHINS